MSSSYHALPIALKQGLSLNLGGRGLVLCWLGWKCASLQFLFLPLSELEFQACTGCLACSVCAAI